MPENGTNHNGIGAYDTAFMTWMQVSPDTCRDPNSDMGHWVQGLMAGMLAWQLGCPERAAGIVRAARAGAAVMHGTELVTRRELL